MVIFDAPVQPSNRRASLRRLRIAQAGSRRDALLAVAAVDRTGADELPAVAVVGRLCRCRRGRRASMIASPQTLQIGSPASSAAAGPAATMAIPSLSCCGDAHGRGRRGSSAPRGRRRASASTIRPRLRSTWTSIRSGLTEMSIPPGGRAGLRLAIDQRTAGVRNVAAISVSLAWTT